jgi:RNA polymerase-associated protein RTF1
MEVDNEGEEDDDGLIADEDEEFEEEEDEDDLFDSDEEKEISKRPTKKGGDDEFDEDDEEEDRHEEDRDEEGEVKSRKRSKTLGKKRKSHQSKKSAPKRRRSSRFAAASDEDEEAEDDEEEEEELSGEEDLSDDDDLERSRKLYGSDDDNQHEYNLKSIKDAHKKAKNDGREPSSAAEKPLVFESLSKLKQHLEKQLQKELPIKPDDNDPADLTDFRKLFKRRDDIINILHEPFFDQLIIGCYIRYLIGVMDNQQVYRMCEVTGVDRSKKSYKLPPLSNGTILETNVRLHLNNAGDTKQLQKLEKISNHSLQDKEIEFHIVGMKSHPEKEELTKRAVRIIRNRHRSYAEHNYTHSDISNMVANKMGFNKLITTEYTTAMNILKKRLMEATENGDKERTDLIRKEIKQLDEINDKQKLNFDQFAKKQVDINRRMRESNVVRDMDAGMRKRHDEQAAIAKGILPNAISDPFIRRETRPKILWNTSDTLQKKKENNGNKEDDKENKKTEEKNKADAKEAKKLRMIENDRWAVSTQLSLSEVVVYCFPSFLL